MNTLKPLLIPVIVGLSIGYLAHGKDSKPAKVPEKHAGKDMPGKPKPPEPKKMHESDEHKKKHHEHAEKKGPEIKKHLHLWMKLDTNADGVLSPDEIAAAPAVLAALDTDKDGSLSYEESGIDHEKSFEHEMEKMKEEQGKHKKHDDDDDHKENPKKPGAMPQSGSSTASAKVSQWMSFDKNGDGKLTADEIPQRMSAILGKADSDKDNALTPAELEAYLSTQP